MARVSIILPAYNEGEIIASVVQRVRAVAENDWEIIIVDDGSSDDTAERAALDGVRVVRHPYNKGNGAAVKTGLRAASGEVVCLMDADGQHDPAEIPDLLAALQTYDLVIGARADGGGAGGIFRRIGNAFYNRLATYLSGQKVLDLTSGFRAAWRDKMVEFLPLFPNGFSYPTTSTLAFIKAGYNVGYVPIHASKRVGRSKIRLLRDGTKFVVIALRMIVLFSPMRVFLPASIVMFLGGAGYGAYTTIVRLDVTDSTVLLITMSVVTFFIGLISEQIAMMRFERLQK
ncbi:MAG: glycosyltransferase family 2 protein [Acidobacteriota bacterium]